MNVEVRMFLRQLLILASLTGIGVIGLILLLPPQFVSPVLPFILVFHTAATLISFLFIHKKVQESPQKFVNVYMANTTIKLLLYLVILMVYSLNFLHDAVNFIISFFVMYLIFTVFEVVHLVKMNKGVSSR
jgi:F0F1-type ATP synthase assembly protein I